MQKPLMQINSTKDIQAQYDALQARLKVLEDQEIVGGSRARYPAKAHERNRGVRVRNYQARPDFKNAMYQRGAYPGEFLETVLRLRFLHLAQGILKVLIPNITNDLSKQAKLEEQVHILLNDILNNLFGHKPKIDKSFCDLCRKKLNQFANYFSVHCHEVMGDQSSQEYFDAILASEQYLCLQVPRQEAFTETFLETAAISQREIPQHVPTRELVEEYGKLFEEAPGLKRQASARSRAVLDSAGAEDPAIHWFDALKPFEQKIVKAHFEKYFQQFDKALELEQAGKPAQYPKWPDFYSILRRVPGAANFTKHQVSINVSGRLFEFEPIFRAATPTPKDIRRPHGEVPGLEDREERHLVKRDELRRIAVMNLRQEREAAIRQQADHFANLWGLTDGAFDLPMVFQSLLSPTEGIAGKMDITGKAERDCYEDLVFAVDELNQEAKTVDLSGGRLVLRVGIALTNQSINSLRGHCAQHGSLGKQNIESTLERFMEQVIFPRLKGKSCSAAFKDLWEECKKGLDSEQRQMKINQFFDQHVTLLKSCFSKLPEAQRAERVEDLRKLMLTYAQYQDLYKREEKPRERMDHNRNLHLAALERIMMHHLHGAFLRACSATKDRSGVVCDYEAAMLTAHAQDSLDHPQACDYVTWKAQRSYSDEPRSSQTFRQAFQELMGGSMHSAAAANDNTPGAYALKLFNVGLTRIVPKPMLGGAYTDEHEKLQLSLSRSNRLEFRSTNKPYEELFKQQRVRHAVAAFKREYPLPKDATRLQRFCHWCGRWAIRHKTLAHLNHSMVRQFLSDVLNKIFEAGKFTHAPAARVEKTASSRLSVAHGRPVISQTSPRQERAWSPKSNGGGYMWKDAPAPAREASRSEDGAAAAAAAAARFQQQ